MAIIFIICAFQFSLSLYKRKIKDFRSLALSHFYFFSSYIFWLLFSVSAVVVIWIWFRMCVCVFALVSVLLCSCVSNSCFWVNAHSSNKQKKRRTNERTTIATTSTIRIFCQVKQPRMSSSFFFRLSVSIITFHFNSIQFNSLALFCSSNSGKMCMIVAYQTSYIDMPYAFNLFVVRFFSFLFFSFGRFKYFDVYFMCGCYLLVVVSLADFTWLESFERFSACHFFFVHPPSLSGFACHLLFAKGFFCSLSS